MVRERRGKKEIEIITAGLLGLVLTLLLMVQTAAAVDTDDDVMELPFDPVRNSESFSAVVYDNTNGLPASEANTIVQTSEGFIWIGSYAGLIRYDGRIFERLDSTHGVNSISCLYVDTQDRLWIGTNDSGVAVMEDGGFRFWGENEGLGSFKVNDIDGDANGNIYVGTTAGVAMFKPDLEMVRLDDERIDDVYVESMCSDSDQLVYGTTHDGNVFILRDGNLVNYLKKDETMVPISCVYPDRNRPGWIYYGTETDGVFHVNPASGFKTAERIDISPLMGVDNLTQIGDYLWVLTRTGIGAIGRDGFHSLDYLPLNNSIDNVIKDYEGNLWFTSSRQGIMKLTANRFTDISARYGIGKAVVNTTCMLDGKLFIGSDTGLTVTDGEGKADSIPLTKVSSASGDPIDGIQNSDDLLKLLDGVRIRSIIRDSKDRLWISTWRSLGLLRYDHGKLTVFNESEGLLSDQIRSVYETNDGRMLVALAGGLNIIEDDRVTASYSKSDGISNQESLAVCEAPNGDLLVGSNGDGIYVIGKDGTRNIGRKDGLTTGVVMRIKYDEKNKVFWLVTGNSLAYMTEDYEVTIVSNFPYPDNLDLFINSRGSMWILSSDGIYIAPVKDLLENEATDPAHYGIANGLPSIVTSNSYNYLTEDGDLYLAGRTGVSKINIEETFEEIQDLKMAVPFIDVDSERVYPDEKGVFRIPASARKLAIHGYVFNYSLIDPLVSFQLMGFDKKMMTFRRSNFGTLYYTNLPGGTYRFVMQLKNSMGRRGKTVIVTIDKAKAFYEQVWFYVIALLTVSGIVLAIVEMQIRRRIKKLEAKHLEMAEKERVANELYMASQIQAGVLPHDFPPFPERKEFDLFAMMAPAREVGGDLYDFFLIDDDHLALVIGDVSGKGIPASLFMMTSKVLLKSLASGNYSPAEVLEKANDEICANNQMELFVTVWLGILELSSGKIVAANAGHEYPVIGGAGKDFKIIKGKHNFVVGGMEGVKYSNYELQLDPGDKLFIYTDGVPEAANKNKEMFGTGRMLDALNADKYAPVEEMLRNVRGAVAEFAAGAEQFDDLTMLAVEYNGPVTD